MYNLTLCTKNAKTGPIATTMTAPTSCPAACPLRNKGCYAAYGPLSWMWKKHCTLQLPAFLRALQTLPLGHSIRLNQAGDLPPASLSAGNDAIDAAALSAIAAALSARRARAWTYTHYPPTAHNLAAIRAAAPAITVNLSANSPDHADTLHAAAPDLPLVTVLPSSHPARSTTPGGLPIRVCPAQTDTAHHITCAGCVRCHNPRRRYIVGFRAHGAGARHIAL